MRLLHHGPVPDNADFVPFFRVFPGKAGAPVLVAGGSLLLSHSALPPKRKTTKQNAASRLAPRKPMADLLVTGRAYSNFEAYGHAKAVRVAVEIPAWRWRKELAVFGDRVWLPGLTGSAPSEPVPFKSVPVDYSCAYGGAGYAWNPLGLGTGGGERGARLPNIEFVDRPLTSPASAPGPAGFGPIDATWQPRAGRIGTYGEDWQRNHWPGMPADFSLAYWNEAPADQQFQGGFKGSEVVTVHNMHPAQRQFDLALPGLRCRLFLKKTDGAFAEIPAMLDTVAMDMEAAHTELIWRGATAVQYSRLRDAAFLFALLEPVAANTPLAQCEALFESTRQAKYPTEAELTAKAAMQQAAAAAAAAQQSQEIEQTVAALTAEMKEKKLAAQEHLARLQAEAGATTAPDNDDTVMIRRAPRKRAPAPWTRERVLAQLAAGDKNFAQAELSALDLNGIDFAGADLAGAKLKGTWLQGANLTGAKLTGVAAPGALLSGAILTQARLTGADFAGAFFTKAVLAGVDFSGLDLTAAHFEEAQASGASFAKAKASGAKFSAARLEKADFFKAQLADAVFDGACLNKASFMQAVAPGSSFNGCEMVNIRAAEADFRKAMFTRAHAPSSLWRRAKLDAADFTRSTLTKANFAEAELPRACFNAALLEMADFGEVVMTQARMVYAKALRANFERADLQGTDFSGANLYQAGFCRALMRGVTLTDSLLTGTLLA